MPNRRPLSAGPELYAAVRAGFVAQRSSLNAWCAKSGVTPAWARQALLGLRGGHAAALLRARIARASKARPVSAMETRQ